MNNFPVDPAIMRAPHASALNRYIRANRFMSAISIGRLLLFRMRFASAAALWIGGFLVFNLLATLGVVVVFFILLGNGNPSAFAMSVNQVTYHFLQAPAQGQAGFLDRVGILIGVQFMLFCVFRYAGLHSRIFGKV